jgi:hypothetical protein
MANISNLPEILQEFQLTTHQYKKGQGRQKIVVLKYPLSDNTDDDHINEPV